MQRFWLVPSFWCLILLSSIYLTRSKYSKKRLRKFSKRTKYQVCRREYSDYEKLIVEDLLKRRKKGLSEYISSNQQKCVFSKSKYNFDRVLDFGIGLMLNRPHIQFKDTCTIFCLFPLGKGCKLSVPKTFWKRHVCSFYVLCPGWSYNNYEIMKRVYVRVVLTKINVFFKKSYNFKIFISSILLSLLLLSSSFSLVYWKIYGFINRYTM